MVLCFIVGICLCILAGIGNIKRNIFTVFMLLIATFLIASGASKLIVDTVGTNKQYKKLESLECITIDNNKYYIMSGDSLIYYKVKNKMENSNTYELVYDKNCKEPGVIYNMEEHLNNRWIEKYILNENYLDSKEVYKVESKDIFLTALHA